MRTGVLPLLLTLAAQGLSPATPIEPIGAILDAFRSHSIVALPNSHRSEQVHAFDLAVVRDPRTADIVDDIVVEFGNARNHTEA
jgi:hypothetical protein